MTIALVLLMAAVIVYFGTRDLRGEDVSTDGKLAPAPTSAARGRGADPWPIVPRLLAGGIEIIDLRRLPIAALRQGALDSVSEQLRAGSPYVGRCFVIDAATLEGWLALEPVALMIVAGRCKDAAHASKVFLHAPGFRVLTAPENALLADVGLDVALEIKGVGAQGSTDLLAQVAPVKTWRREPDGRPVPGSAVHGDSLASMDLVTFITPMAFIDLRRPSARRRTSASFFDELAKILDKVIASPAFAPTETIWIVGPWILEEWRDNDAVDRLLTVVERVRRCGPLRLAMVDVMPEARAAHDEHPIVQRLVRAGFTPVANQFEWKTSDGNVYRVDALTALEDAYGYHAWQKVEARLGANSPS